MTEELTAQAVIDALNAAQAAAYDVDDLTKMAATPLNYVEVTVSRRYAEGDRLTGGRSTRSWRITTRVVTKTVSNAREYRRRVETALERRTLLIEGKRTTPVQLETESPIGPDDGWFSGLTTWTFTV